MKFGIEFTGQPFINEFEMVACPTCKKAISAKSTGWFDPHCKEAADGTPLKNGGYVCKEHLSEQRKEEIRKEAPGFSDFKSEKDWVDSEQVGGPKPGPLDNLLTIVSKAQGDPELMDGVRKVFEAVASLEKADG